MMRWNSVSLKPASALCPLLKHASYLITHVQLIKARARGMARGHRGGVYNTFLDRTLEPLNTEKFLREAFEASGLDRREPTIPPRTIYLALFWVDKNT